MLATFLSLRVGVGVIGIVFPFLLVGGGKIAGIHPAHSMSAYYHATPACIDPKHPEPTAPCSAPLQTGTGPMRNWFVGILFVMGVCLYLIKGFSHWEDIFLTIAGILAVCVAIFPMPWTDETVTGFPKHYASAITFFILIAFVCMFCSGKTLKYMPPNTPHREAVIARYKLRYRVLAVCMVLSPVTAYVFNVFTGQHSYVFWAEAFGVWAFGIFWLVKTKELRLSDVERRALKGEVDMDMSTLR